MADFLQFVLSQARAHRVEHVEQVYGSPTASDDADVDAADAASACSRSTWRTVTSWSWSEHTDVSLTDFNFNEISALAPDAAVLPLPQLVIRRMAPGPSDLPVPRQLVPSLFSRFAGPILRWRTAEPIPADIAERIVLRLCRQQELDEADEPWYR